MALFRHEADLAHAVARLRDSGIGPLETYTPAPMRDAPTQSPIPLVVLVAGVLGACASLALQTYSAVAAYPFLAGGRPLFAWPSFVPTVFENAVLVAVVAGFVAFMVLNGLPKLYDPVDEAEAMREASRDGWVVAVRTRDARLRAHAQTLLGRLGAERVEEIVA